MVAGTMRNRFALCLALDLALACRVVGVEAVEPQAEFTLRRQRLEMAKRPSVKEWLALADFCESKLLFAERGDALRAALQVDANNASAHARLDEMKVGKQWLPIQRALQQEIEENEAKGRVYYGKGWVTAAQRDAMLAQDRKLVGWNCDLRVDMQHVTVYSEDSVLGTRLRARLLENTGYAYEQFHRGTLTFANGKPLRVYLFKDVPRFLATYAALNGKQEASTTVGLYYHKILYIVARVDLAGSHPRTPDHVAIHEMTHALDDNWITPSISGGGQPSWCEEGRAEFLGYSILGLQVLPGSSFVREDQCPVLVLRRSVGSWSLQNLFALGGGYDTYVLGQAVVHFLHCGDGGRYDAGFRSYLHGLPGKRSQADLEAALGTRLVDLDPAFRAHVQGAFLP
jgi:hypothetical protein